MSVNACLQHLALKPTIFVARQPHKIYCCHVQVTEEVPVSPSAEAVIVAVLGLPAQVRLHAMVAVFCIWLATATQPSLVVY